MGDVSIIARRIPGGYVQYGWSGNGGYYKHVGYKLLESYTEPDKVEYLFGLGQTARIGRPGSENGGQLWYFTHQLTGEPFWLDKTERMIFSQIAFIDYGYFYDSDNTWYYIIPGPFRIKIPLSHIADNLDDKEYEFDYCRLIEKKLISYMFGEYLENNSDFRAYLIQKIPADENSLAEKVSEIRDGILAERYPIHDGLYEKYRVIFDYFDDWVVVVPTDSGLQFKMKKKTETHIETIEW